MTQIGTPEREWIIEPLEEPVIIPAPEPDVEPDLVPIPG